jgi:hypothetical protein
MKLVQLGSNQMELQVGDARILVSYETPVAAYTPERGYIRTAKFWSRTTSKHINRWLPTNTVAIVPQEDLNALLNG